MGENNTAALDPIFFFHHCYIDRMFWLWQKRHGQTDTLEIIEDYPGTSSSDSQGPTPGIPPGTPLGLTTPLAPFHNPDTDAMFTSNDCVNIEKLGYTYGPGSFDDMPRAVQANSGFSTRKLSLRGVDRALFQGSFVLSGHARVEGPDGKVTIYPLGHHSVLSRWSVTNCANCRTHLEVIAHFPLNSLTEEDARRATFTVKVHHRGAKVPASFNAALTVRD